MTDTNNNATGNDDPQHPLKQNQEDVQKSDTATNSFMPVEEVEETSEEEDESDPDADEWPMEEDDPDDSYGSSYEKYNGYNGYSDDVIDDAFEGDPEATWNVD